MMPSNQKVNPEAIVRKVLIGVMLGVIVIAGLLMFIDFKKVMIAMANMPVHYLLLAFLLTFCSYLLRLWKWHAFTKWSQFSLRLKDNAVIFFVGLIMSITPGKAGELIKSYFMQVKGDRSEEHTSELQSRFDLVCRLLLEIKNVTKRDECMYSLA